MDEDEERRRQEEWRRSLKPLKEDSGYAKNYSTYLEEQARQTSGVFVILYLFIAIVSGLIVAFKYGWFREAALLTIFCGTVFAVSIPVRKLLSLRRQDELYNAAVDRKNGIDKRWGRHGAKGKKKNARN